ncbi:AraC family transcriptional regulator [Burkholderia cenocepacia]|uniref:AraC family transcriptional regulator n=1 Tax=Burkholderia cenocepacia TaxID=95486 RepID=UPI001903C4AD|nr:AraC family transcriptional regulator [Burkholderia cenocepacia]MBJ9698550.1 AraC family transcriptional regulator [Burkholderia cenocepacia]
MNSSEYRSTSLTESREILCREWSRHVISVEGGGRIDLQFRNLKISGDMTVSRLSYGTDVAIDPTDRDEVLLLQMPSSGKANVRYGSYEVSIDPQRYGLIDVRRVEQARYDADFSALVLRIRLSRIREHVQTWLGYPLRREFAFHDHMDVGSSAAQRWAPIAGMLGSFVDHASTSFPGKMMASVEDTVLTALLFSQSHSFDDEIRRPGSLPAPRHVKRAEEYVLEHAGDDLSTPLLAAHVNVSVRALFDGFRNFRHMTPTDFIRQVRLERARADLQAGGQTVSAIASKWGFRHLGNFATHYRKRYGESPVDTLRFGHVTHDQ